MGVLSDPHKLRSTYCAYAHHTSSTMAHMRQSDQTHVYEVPLGVPLMLRSGWGHTYEVHTVPRVAQGESLQNLKHGVPVRTVTKRWQGRMDYEVGPPPENEDFKLHRDQTARQKSTKIVVSDFEEMEKGKKMS